MLRSLPSKPSAVAVDFQLVPTQHSGNVSFSLTCNLIGGEVSSVTWTRDGFLLDNTGPLVLTDTATHSYANVLEVNGRTRGTYTCQAIGVDNQVLSSATIDVQGWCANSYVEFSFLS